MRRRLTFPMIAVTAATLASCGGSGCGTRCGNAASPAARTAPGTPATTATSTTAAPSRGGPATAQPRDLAAESLVRTAQAAVETLATDDNGSYTRISPKAIAMLEPNIPITRNGRAYLSAARGTNTTYRVTATSASGDTFTISRDARGAISRTCTGRASPECHAGKW